MYQNFPLVLSSVVGNSCNLMIKIEQELHLSTRAKVKTHIQTTIQIFFEEKKCVQTSFEDKLSSCNV